MDAPDSPMTDSSSSPAALISPPASQGDALAANTARPVDGANINGKRPRNYISNGDDSGDRPVTRSTGGAGASSTRAAEPQAHASGYTWSRAEDAPGYGWMNKKAQDESARAWETVIHKDLMIKARYGDPFELAEQEAAFRASLKER